MNITGPATVDRSSRRQMLQASLALATTGACAGLTPISAWATPAGMRAAIGAAFGERPINEGRVALRLPQVAENGASVQLAIDVDSPASQTEYVKSLHVFSEKNPIPEVCRFFFAPGAGKATVTTRIRLADSQTIVAIATLSDESLWSGAAKSIVTLAACISTD